MSQRWVGAVVAQEQNQGLFGDPQVFKMVQHFAQGFVHALDQRSQRLGVFSLVRMTVVIDEPGVGVDEATPGPASRSTLGMP